MNPADFVFKKVDCESIRRVGKDKQSHLTAVLAV
jgi:hypothetical protein